MEVLANGMKVNFWIPVEEEPDVDRFVDEQIMIDMDKFMLVGTLEKVATCKKKNEEKEFEYFKQLTVQVNNICLASDNNFNITIPAKKEEFMYDVKFRYAPEPEQEAGGDMEPVEEAAAAAKDLNREPVGPEDADYLAEQKAGPDYEGIESPSAEEMIAANEALPEEPAAEAKADPLDDDDLFDDDLFDENPDEPGDDDPDPLDDPDPDFDEPGDDDPDPDFEETPEEEADRLTGDMTEDEIDDMFDEPSDAEKNQTPEDLEEKDTGTNPVDEAGDPDDLDPDDEFDDIDWGE